MAQSRSRDTFQPGDLLNNTYRIESVLGRGGTSEVYRARSEISGRVVALKVLKAELSANVDYLRLMTREEAIRDVRHDAVVRYSENHRTPDGHVYLIMDYVDGPPLDRLMAKGPVSADDLMVIGARVTEGLVAAHAKNIVHRDLSPDNIILRGGEPDEAVIIDFGIAKDDRPGAETIVGNEFAGKYAYAAPEQLYGRTDPRSDLYALGATLLACFRGQVPDLGTNPVEMLRIKGAAPDTTGVPEPLKGIIDRLCKPEPKERYQTAAEVLAAFRPAPVQTAAPRSAPPAAEPKAPPPAPTAVLVQPRRGGGLGLVLMLVLAVGAAGGGAWYGGLLDRFLVQPLPVADPFALTVAQAAGGKPQAKGVAPDEATQKALAEMMARVGGTAEVTLAQGTIAEGWGGEVMALLSSTAVLPEWQVSVSGNEARVTGMAPDRASRDAAVAAMTSDVLEVSADIGFGPRILLPDTVRDVLAAHQDCGPLALPDAPPAGWGTGAKVLVAGRMASDATRLELFQALGAAIGDRAALMDIEVLNPELCAIEAALPRAPSKGFKVIFGFGDRADPNPAGRYFVGENPVIDVVIPADVTAGNLWISIVDVTGSVFHLLPNLNRPENDIATLRSGQTGEVTVRVAYSVAEATGTPKMAFLVDDSIMGKSKIVILHAPEPVFAELRPMSESVASFAAALAGKESGEGMAPVFSIDSRILTTEKP